MLKAIEKDPARRYPTAEEMGADIERFLEQKPVLAKKASTTERAAKWAARHRSLVASTASFLVVAALGLAAGTYLVWKERQSAQAALTQVLRLSDVKRLAELEAGAKSLWPSAPQNAEAMAGWIKKAEELAGRLDLHRATLAGLRSGALPHDPRSPAAEDGAPPQTAEIESLQTELEGLLALAARIESSAGDARATVVSYGGDPARKHPCYYFRHSFPLEGAAPEGVLKLRVLADDGASVYLGGTEVARLGLPEGTLSHGTLATRTVRQDQYESFEVPASLLRPGANVLAAEVHQASVKSADRRFDLELQDGAGETLVPSGALWRYEDSGRDLGASWRDPGFDDSAWASGPAVLGYEFQDGPGRAAEQRLRAARLEKRIARLSEEAAAWRPWRFLEPEVQWQHDMLAGLVASLEAFAGTDREQGTLASVRKRLAFASSVRRLTVDERRDAWDRAMASIADEKQCPLYAGFRIEPQVGLVPLGPDPRSGLWEFALIETGEPPSRDAEGKLSLAPESAIVLVLLPGGTFRMGAERPTSERPEGSPNVDPNAGDESPVHDVTLDPFFMSKYEMTQAQWQRATGQRPDEMSSEGTYPVETVSWEMCREVLFRLGLVFPTEAQWEYAARAGTTTVWWTGNEKESLRGAANLADRTVGESGVLARGQKYDDWLDDGHEGPAPVGSFLPNPFGLHDVLGNVWELCRDHYGSYRDPVRPRTGERVVRGEISRVSRGGGWDQPSEGYARSAARLMQSPGVRYGTLGVRPARELTR